MLRRAALIANGFMDKAKAGGLQHPADGELPCSATRCRCLATSSTCGFTLRDEYPHLLEQDNHKVRDRIRW